MGRSENERNMWKYDKNGIPLLIRIFEPYGTYRAQQLQMKCCCAMILCVFYVPSVVQQLLWRRRNSHPITTG